MRGLICNRSRCVLARFLSLSLSFIWEFVCGCVSVCGCLWEKQQLIGDIFSCSWMKLGEKFSAAILEFTFRQHSFVCLSVEWKPTTLSPNGENILYENEKNEFVRRLTHWWKYSLFNFCFFNSDYINKLPVEDFSFFRSNFSVMSVLFWSFISVTFIFDRRKAFRWRRTRFKVSTVTSEISTRN